MGKNKKRKHTQYVQDGNSDRDPSHAFALASTLVHIQPPSLLTPNSASTTTTASPTSQAADSDGGEWQTVDGRGKRAKKQKRTKQNVVGKRRKDNYPALAYSELHRLKSSIKIFELQSLVLYCLADGTSPQWLSVKHHTQVKKAVVLLIPGLDKGMFDGSIVLQESTPNGDAQNTSSEACDEVEASTKDVIGSRVASNIASHPETTYISSTTSPDEYMPTLLSAEKLPPPLKPLADMFAHLWPVRAPGDDKYYKVHSPLHAMLTAPIPKSKEERREDQQTKGPKPKKDGQWENKRTPVTAFLTSAEDLRENEYTLHPVYFISPEEKDQEAQRRQKSGETAETGWTDTLVDNFDDGIVPDQDIQKGSMTAGRSIVAMDCEMCMVEGNEMALTRISLVDWTGTVIMDELVKPEKPILDYLTPYSGITSAKLGPITTTLSEIQTRLLTLITPRTILIGHSLNSDLNALKLTHPFIIDTTIIYQHPRGPPLKSSLKWLAQKYLSREIQKGHGATGHDSIEDALACLDLVKLKCEKGPRWGTTEASGESIFKRLARTIRSESGSAGIGKIGAIIDHGSPERNFGAMAQVCIPCTTDAEVVQGVKRAVLGDPDGILVPGGGVDFTWARLRELESARGWSNDNRQANSIISFDPFTTSSNPTPATLSAALTQTIHHIKTIHDFLPPCTLLIVYSGTGDPREMGRLQEMQRTFKREYAVRKWDELSVRWTDVEEQALRKACGVARAGVGFVGIV